MTHRFGIGLRSWPTAAVLLAIVILIGTGVEGVVAAHTTPSPVAVMGPHVDADPTATPEPTQSPTQTTEPPPSTTPTLEVTPTPTPADAGGAEIVARKVIDADGDVETVDDQTAGEGWEIELDLRGGEIEEAFPVTNGDGIARWLVRVGPGGASATVTEVPQENFALVDAVCSRISDGGDTSVGEFHEGSVTFRVADVGFSRYQCDFFNVPTDMSLAGISVWMHLDTDGDLDTFEDIVSPPSWEFEAAFEDGVELVSADRDTSGDEPAGWLIRHAGDSTRVVITAVPQNGYRLVTASCIDGDSSDGMEIETTLNGNRLSFDVSGFSPIAPFPHGYLCDFLTLRSGDTVMPTLPPTDVATDSVAPGSRSWGLLFVGLTTLLASLVLVGSRQRAATGGPSRSADRPSRMRARAHAWIRGRRSRDERGVP